MLTLLLCPLEGRNGYTRYGGMRQALSLAVSVNPVRVAVGAVRLTAHYNMLWDIGRSCPRHLSPAPSFAFVLFTIILLVGR